MLDDDGWDDDDADIGNNNISAAEAMKVVKGAFVPPSPPPPPPLPPSNPLPAAKAPIKAKAPDSQVDRVGLLNEIASGKALKSTTAKPITVSSDNLASAVTKGLGAETPEQRKTREDREDAESKARVAAANEAKKMRDAAAVVAAADKAAKQKVEPKATSPSKDMKEEIVKKKLKEFEDYQQKIKIASKMADPDDRENAILDQTTKYKNVARLSPTQLAAFEIYLEANTKESEAAFKEFLNVIETTQIKPKSTTFGAKQAMLEGVIRSPEPAKQAAKTKAGSEAQAPRLTRQEVQDLRESIGALYNAANAKLQQEIPLAPLPQEATLEAHIKHVEEALGLVPSGATILNDDLLNKVKDALVVPGARQEASPSELQAVEQPRAEVEPVVTLSHPPAAPPMPSFGAGQSAIPTQKTTHASTKAPFLAQIESRRSAEHVVDPDKAVSNTPDPAPVVAIFDKNSAIGQYLSSKTPEELAISLYNNMHKHNIEIPKVIVMDSKVKESFSSDVLSQMQKVGEKLESHRASRSGFVGKLRQVGDGIAAAWHGFTSLFGKKVDDPKLKAACDEYQEKSNIIMQKGDNTKKISTFAEQILASKGGVTKQSR